MLEEIQYKSLLELGIQGSQDALVAMVDQRSREWLRLKGGKVSASNVHLIVTPTGKARTGKMREDYLDTLILERTEGIVDKDDEWIPKPIQWGRDHESEAKKAYCDITKQEIVDCGFVFKDTNKDCGCSPDGLMEYKGLEVKCLYLNTCIRFLRTEKAEGLLKAIDPTHYMQMQFSMWITGLPVWDYVIFYPQKKPIIRTIQADSTLHKAFSEHIPTFLSELRTGCKAIEGW